MMNELEKIPTERKKFSQYVLGNARTLMIAFILFTVVVVMTTDIKFITISSIRDIGLEFFLILFASYAMYACCADGGTSAGLATDAYKESVARFTDLKKQILENSRYSRMNEFCSYYIEEELKKTRMQYLIVAGIKYTEYIEKYAKLSRAEIKKQTELTDMQKKAIIRANRVRQIRFTPNMMTTMPGKISTRFALSVTPKAQRTIAFSTKFVTMSLLSIGMSLIALKVILEPSWTVFAEVCMKLVTVVVNGFDGRRMGYENITVDTINFTNAQSDLMHQAIQYIDTHPITTND
jgi:hypothetical protein